MQPRRTPVLPFVALACGVTGYVLTFYVRDPWLPFFGVLLMLLAAVLAVVAVARSRRRLTALVASLAVVPLAVLVWAVWAWLES